MKYNKLRVLGYVTVAIVLGVAIYAATHRGKSSSGKESDGEVELKTIEDIKFQYHAITALRALNQPPQMEDSSLTDESVPVEFDTRSTSLEQIPKEIDPRTTETIRLYCQVKTQLEMLNYAAQLSQVSRAFEPMPDDFDTRSEEYRKMVHRDLDYFGAYLWDEGKSVDCFFDGEHSELIPIPEDLYAEFVKDPFDPKGRPFQYAVIPIVGGNLILTISVGPDGDLNLDPEKLDARLPDLGFGTSPLNLVYDPTNGLMSRGDIVKFNSGDTYQAEMIDIFVKTWEEP